MPKLTKRQIEVIDLARQGLLQSEIAKELDVSVRQIYRITREARELLEVKSNQELIAKAIGLGLLPPRHQ